MKKLQLLTGALLVASSVFAQKAVTSKIDFTPNAKRTIKTIPAAKSVAIWSDDFSTPSNWTMTNTGADDVNWTIETEADAMPNVSSGTFVPFASNSLSNGYALINSDGAPNNADGNGAIIAQITTASAIDMSAHSSILLKFNHNYRWWHEDRGVRVSGDNGATWTEYPITSETGGVIPDGYPNEQSSENPKGEEINISSVAGGQSQVLIQFYYNDNDFWSWFWAVDDVEIVEQPANDIILNSAWFSNTDGVEYARMPESQIPDTLTLGASVLNFGVQDQTNIVVELSIENESGTQVFSESLSQSTLESDSIVYFEAHQTNPTLAEGLYTLNATATSTEDTEDGDNSENNSYSRNLEITNNLYSIDGIGVIETPTLTTVGTNYGEGAIVLAMYNIIEETTVVGLEIAISSGTDAGGFINAFLMDGTNVLSANIDIDDRIAQNDVELQITQYQVDNGLVFAEIPSTTLQPGIYYACAELYNGSNEGDGVYILDDETVGQPSYASMLYSYDEESGDGDIYTNGTAVAIRLAIGDYIGLEEEAKTALFSVSPNPSNGVFTVTANNADNYTLEVINVLGEVVSTKSIEGSMNETVNVSELNAGIYFVKVSTATSQNVQRVVIK